MSPGERARELGKPGGFSERVCLTDTSVFGTFVDVYYGVRAKHFEQWLYVVVLKVPFMMFECICFSILLDFPNLC